jgi:putative ABC transport system permease protein
VNAANPNVQRQISLPTSKAVEIAWKSIRLRLSRSLLVTSGIVLAIAFLISIQISQAITNGLRNGIAQAQTNAQQHPSVATQDAWIHAQLLAGQMSRNGVPTTAADIESNRIQTRWLLGLALLVAFVGILNAMLMSVTERFREIGTMKCLGALDTFIIKLFLIESLFQGVVGTVIGVVVGVLLSLLSAWSSYRGDALSHLPMSEIGVAVLISFLIGIGLTVFGAVYPAWQAARMHPIEAMRSET